MWRVAEWKASKGSWARAGSAASTAQRTLAAKARRGTRMDFVTDRAESGPYLLTTVMLGRGAGFMPAPRKKPGWGGWL